MLAGESSQSGLLSGEWRGRGERAVNFLRQADAGEGWQRLVQAKGLLCPRTARNLTFGGRRQPAHGMAGETEDVPPRMTAGRRGQTVRPAWKLKGAMLGGRRGNLPSVARIRTRVLLPIESVEASLCAECL